MGRKIFISYKYADDAVRQFNDINNIWRKQDTVLSYVDLLEDYFKQRSDHIYKGESDGEDLSYLSESTIQDKLYDRIYDSTMTIVMVSQNMKDLWKTQKNQWIPREISYSLRNQSRTNSSGRSVISSTNAILAIVLPDRSGSYAYFMDGCTLCDSTCTIYKTDFLFKILRDNTFNIKNPDSESCGTRGNTIYHGESSYVLYVKWDDFKGSEEHYIDRAYSIRDNKDKYDIHVQLD